MSSTGPVRSLEGRLMYDQSSVRFRSGDTAIGWGWNLSFRVALRARVARTLAQ